MPTPQHRVRSAAVIVSLLLVVLAGAAAPALAGGGEEGKSARAILADVKRELAKVRSFHFAGTETDKDGGKTRIAGDITSSGRAKITIVDGGASIRMVLLPRSAYLKANAAYWKANGGAAGAKLADRLANRWVKVSAAIAKSLRPLADQLAPKHLAACTEAGIGTLVKRSPTTIGGRRVVVIEDKGDKPGTEPGLLYVAASGRALPLRATQTGPMRPGGHLPKECDTGGSTSTASDLSFSRYDAVATIRAPRGAVAMEDAAGGGSTPV